jgi:hypothetical protein
MGYGKGKKTGGIMVQILRANGYRGISVAPKAGIAPKA